MGDTKSKDTVQLVTFIINNELFGMDIKMISEVNPSVNIIPIPLSEPHIKGHINVRGQVVLVLDLYVVFGRESRPVGDKSHIIIFKTIQDFVRTNIYSSGIDTDAFGDKSIAILVDEIGDVINIYKGDIEISTQNLKNTYSEFTDGVAKLNNNLLIIVNPEKVLKYSREGSLSK